MNEHLEKAKKVKNDEFYTPYEEVESGISPYKSQFKGKIVYCNCDDKTSNFYKYFKKNFRALGLKKLYISGLHMNHAISYDGVKETKYPIKSGDYACACVTSFVKKCDIICTNPPFSIFTEYFKFLWDSGKKFLVIAPLLAMGYKDVFAQIKNKKVNIAEQKSVTFLNGKDVGIIWLTNFPIKRPKPLDTGVKFKEVSHKKFDNFPKALSVNRVNEIPMDYKGTMGVPLTFLTQWNPKQYKIINEKVEHDAYVDGVNKFSRIFIKKQ